MNKSQPKITSSTSGEIDNDIGNVGINCLFNIATCHASEGDFSKAIELIEQINSNDTYYDSLYNRALCYYHIYDYDKTIHCVDNMLNLYRNSNERLLIIHDRERCFEYLKKSHIIEAINLKSAAIFKQNNDFFEAKRCIESSLSEQSIKISDPISRHNLAIYESQSQPLASLEQLKDTLTHSLDNEGVEDKNLHQLAKRNILLLLLRTGYQDKAKEMFHVNQEMVDRYFSPDIIRFLDICLNMRKDASNQDLIYNQLDNLSNELFNKYNDNKNNVNGEKIDDLIELISCVITHQGVILWDKEQYEILSRLFFKFEPILGNLYSWIKNTAHTLFMMDTRFDDSADLYERLLPKLPDDDDDSQVGSHPLLNIDPMVIANLCVSYVLSGRNSEAEMLIREVESEESEYISLNDLDDASLIAEPTKLFTNYQQDTIQGDITDAPKPKNSTFNFDSDTKPAQSFPRHSSIINLVIGTLYCVKNNYDFGLNRVFRTLEPIEERLHTNTWFHAKQCILSAIEKHCKQLIYLKDELFENILQFLVRCERYGFLVDAHNHSNNSANLSSIESEVTNTSSRQNNSQLKLDDNHHTLNKPLNRAKSMETRGQSSRSLYSHNPKSITYEARLLRSLVLPIYYD